MSSTAFLAPIVFALLFTPILGPVATARQCSPERGQIYINEGRYREAIREFWCLVEAQPTEVDDIAGASKLNYWLVAIPMPSATTPV